MAAIETTLAYFPVIFTKFDGDQTIQDIDDYWAQIERVHRRKELFVSINWMKRHSRELALVKHMGECVKRNDAGTRANCACTAMITDSLGFRFLLSSMFLVHPLPVPYIVSPSTLDAIKFCRTEAAKRGLVLPERLGSPWPDAP